MVNFGIVWAECRVQMYYAKSNSRSFEDIREDIGWNSRIISFTVLLAKIIVGHRTI